MGLWNFIKDAGKAIGIGGSDAAEPAVQIQKEVADLGLDTTGMDISVDGDTVKITGDAVSQEMKEKVILAAGNVEGIAAVDEAVTAPDAADPVFHTVEKGDTLWAISAKHLGNGAHYEKIFEANKPMLSHPDKIYPGQVLRIPT
ncbi:MAG: peptidoglycan-binding protein LysM [Pseudomonadota bacterium]